MLYTHIWGAKDMRKFTPRTHDTDNLQLSFNRLDTDNGSHLPKIIPTIMGSLSPECSRAAPDAG